MSNEYKTNVKCSNPEVVKEIAEATNIRFGKGVLRQGWKSDTEFFVKTNSDSPHDEVQKISRQFPNDVITCFYRDEYHDYSEQYIVEYKAGQDRIVSFGPNYLYDNMPLNKELDRSRILDKLEAFFRRLDTTETDRYSNQRIKWFDEEVTYKFKYYALDGKKYRIEATKVGRKIKFKAFEIRRGNHD